MIKTPNFVKKLNSRMYQYTFNKKNPPVLKGSFKYTTYISDIDYTLYVHFNERFIEILINKLTKLRDFKFMYLNAGIDINFKLPWVIDPNWGCDFDLISAKKWFEEFKSKKLMPSSTLDKIEGILNKKNLLIGDLVDIQKVFNKYNVVKWFLPDIIKGEKVLNGHMYKLLDELKTEIGPVLNSIYIDGDDIISVDIGLVDKQYKYKQPIWSRMYKYYTQNWYKILKSYKKLISKDYELEYRNVMKTMEFTNALLAQANLLNSLIKYKVVPQKSINHIAKELNTNLEKNKILSKKLEEVIELLYNKLDRMAKPYINYFLDKLTYHGKIKTYQRLRLIKVSSIPTSEKKLIKRRKSGIYCPFFKSYEDENINSIAQKLMFNEKKFNICVQKISKNLTMPLDKFMEYTFKKSPVSRLFLQLNKGKNKIYIRGSFINTDHSLFSVLGEKIGEYYRIDLKYLERLRIYLVTGY